MTERAFTLYMSEHVKKLNFWLKKGCTVIMMTGESVSGQYTTRGMTLVVLRVPEDLIEEFDKQENIA